MTNFSMGYAKDLVQNDTISPTLGLIIVEGDTLFTMNRKMAENVAIQHDSLVLITKKLYDCKDVVDTLVLIQNKYMTALEKSKEITDMLKKEIDNKDKVINSYTKIDENQKVIIDGMSKEFRKARNRNKILTGLTIGGITFGFTSFMLLLLK